MMCRAQESLPPKVKVTFKSQHYFALKFFKLLKRFLKTNLAEMITIITECVDQGHGHIQRSTV